jgi:cobyrinic acid a,c-diamide synthase
VDYPRIVISALRGGAGKTILTAGLIAAWREAGLPVAPFKKGPDYIDAGWLALAAGRPCFNLDTFLIDTPGILASFAAHAKGAVSVIEGNRGLFDGADPQGSTSTAELAKLLVSPVLLVLDCTKSTRTMAALVMGCSHFDPDVDIRGVVLNRVAGSRHETNVRNTIETHCGIPVLGALPKLSKDDFPERHMGLIPAAEHAWANEALRAAAALMRKHTDTGRILEAAKGPLQPCPPGLGQPGETQSAKSALEPGAAGTEKPRIGVARDSAFQFYYPENLLALEAAGAEICPISLVHDTSLPELDAFYIGGGFPETHARVLAENASMRKSVQRAAKEGMPVYAECGGLMYLGEALVMQDGTWPMAGVFPVVFNLAERPQGHGYTVLEVTGANPFYPVGSEIRGHEFHYSGIETWKDEGADLVFRMRRGKGALKGMDGLSKYNVLATYTHVHALGTPQWAPALVKSAREWRDTRRARPAALP